MSRLKWKVCKSLGKTINNIKKMAKLVGYIVMGIGVIVIAARLILGKFLTNIPYLNNSTPEWSQRGKIRSSVVPVLEKWDKRIIGGLFDLSDVLRDLHLNLKSSINNFNEYHKDINLENFNLSLLYWKYGIFKLYNTYPSNKSLISLIERFKLWKSNYDKLELHKKTKIIIILYT